MSDQVDTGSGEVTNPAAERPQLALLVQPFPAAMVHQTDRSKGAADYVEHGTITQRLLQVVGPFGWELVEILRGDVRERKDRKVTDKGELLLANVIVGAIWRLTVTIDGERVVVESTGDVENPTNWNHDAARLKDAESDAIKRAAMRFGLGLHLWAQDEYYLAGHYRVAGKEPVPDAPAEPEPEPEPEPEATGIVMGRLTAPGLAPITKFLEGRGLSLEAAWRLLEGGTTQKIIEERVRELDQVKAAKMGVAGPTCLLYLDLVGENWLTKTQEKIVKAQDAASEAAAEEPAA